MKRSRLKYRFNDRGAALLSTFMVVMMLTLLGLATFALALSSLQQSTAADNYERDYYAADRAVQQAVENLKRETLDYYNAMAAARSNTANLTEYNNQYGNFFGGIYADAVASWQEPELQSAAGNGPVSSATSYLAPVKVSDNTYRYTVQSTAAGARASRTVTASITITRNDITYIPGSLPPPFGPEAVITGGTFIVGPGDVPVTGNVRFGAYSNPRSNPPTYSQYDGFKADNKGTGNWIDPTTNSTLGWSVSYPGYTVEPKTNAEPSIPAVTNGATVTNASFPDYNVPSPVYLEGQSGASFTVSGFAVNGGQIYSTGALTLTGGSGFKGTASSYLKLYSSGSMDINSTTTGYAKIYCGGNLTMSGSLSGPIEIYCAGNVTLNGLNLNGGKVICAGSLTINGGSSSNVSIFCKGSFNDKANDRTNVKYYIGGSYTMSGGNFVGNSLVYAEKKMTLESTCSGVFYTNGDATIKGGSGVNGQLVARGNVNVTGSFGFRRNDAIVNAVIGSLGAPFITPGGSSEPQVIQPVNSSIFSGETDTQDK